MDQDEPESARVGQRILAGGSGLVYRVSGKGDAPVIEVAQCRYRS